MLISAIQSAVESDPCFSAPAHHNSNAYDSFIPGLPDDVAMMCLARVHREDFLVIGAVCKRWRNFIQSKYFSFVRKDTGMLKEWLYSYSTDNVDSMIQWEVMSSAKVKVWRIPPMPGSVDAGFSTVALDGNMLIIGGYSKKIGRGSPSADVHQYDARFNRWSMLAKMKVARYEFACSEVDGLIYAVGGYGSDGCELSAAEVYDPYKNEWTSIQELRLPRYRCFGCSFGGKLYVMGGVSTFERHHCSRVDVYSPDRSSWRELKNVVCDMFTAYAVVGEKLFCLYKCELSIFDPADNSWSKVPVPYNGVLENIIKLGVLSNRLLLFSLDYVTMIYDPAAPLGSQWRRSALKAEYGCLCIVTIAA